MSHTDQPSDGDREIPQHRARARGAVIEAEVERWLAAQGMIPVTRNQHAKGGEIDLIMRDGDILVFVEVRYRASNRFGSALESVTSTKQRRLIKAARFYLAQHGLSCSCRFDVVGVEGSSPRSIHWIRHAFEAF
ncbi:YraN family protein [Cobetia sp. L2A1]|uniref:YraN family protein n=1 Tax=Cobetia sp. L2A1 TaxID=2686360 RepID=UPI00131ACB9D|nr:YraN family protein [Cobetia sp. L2A1]